MRSCQKWRRKLKWQLLSFLFNFFSVHDVGKKGSSRVGIVWTSIVLEFGFNGTSQKQSIIFREPQIGVDFSKMRTSMDAFEHSPVVCDMVNLMRPLKVKKPLHIGRKRIDSSVISFLVRRVQDFNVFVHRLCVCGLGYTQVCQNSSNCPPL